MAKNTLFYAIDKNGVIYKSVGLTDREVAILAPKYILDVAGDRIRHGKKYSALHFPQQSFQLINSSSHELIFDKCYGQFLPLKNKSEVGILYPREILTKRLNENTKHMKVVRSILKFFSEGSIKIENFGLDASLLCELEKESSDIDLIVYGDTAAKKCLELLNVLKDKEKGVEDAYERRELYLYRRQPYSPLMSDEEILFWERRKIGGMYNGIKFSVLPINEDAVTDFEFSSTNMFCAIKGVSSVNQIIYEPGEIALEDLEIIYGPNISLDRIYTIVPVRTGVFLKKGDKIFATGIIYRCKRPSETSFVLAQFPWDYVNFIRRTGTAFIIKIDLTTNDTNFYRSVIKTIARSM